jgi:hypothetical protein
VRFADIRVLVSLFQELVSERERLSVVDLCAERLTCGHIVLVREYPFHFLDVSGQIEMVGSTPHGQSCVTGFSLKLIPRVTFHNPSC